MTHRIEAVYISEYLLLKEMVKFQLLCGMALKESWGESDLRSCIEDEIKMAARHP